MNNSRSKQNKKNPEHPFVDIVKYETRVKFQQKNLCGRSLWYLEVTKVFNFLDKQPGFSEIIELCLNLGIEFCIT